MTKVVLLCCVLAGAHVSGAQKAVAASDAWIKLPAAGDTTATAFVVVDNPTMYDVYVMSVATEIAGQVEFRRPPKPGEKPESVPQISAPAYGKVLMKADGIHLLLKDLKRPLKDGEKIWLTLTTDNDVVMEVEAVVRKE